jgi:hypothetical protein
MPLSARDRANRFTFSQTIWRVKWPELQKPMTKLRTDGRVRTVGERNMTRYFPAVATAWDARDTEDYR